jgi:ATP/maltotriose-dependent transcriptional regulator MalT/DNA-binding SARP family transcriptional activator
LSEIKHAYPLILNKVASPNYATPILRRARLLDWLNEAADCRAVVLAADAGYGKTTLLWQWEREVAFPCYWYKLDRNDRDWTFHISYLIESIAKRHKGFGRRTHSMLEQMGGPGSSRPGVAAYLLAEMHQRLTEPCTFIIDDWQYVNAVTEVRGLWNQILRDAPPTCRFVFASRVKPRLQFARFKTHSGYAELRTHALRFTESEIAELFRDIYNDPLNPSELAELERRTEGWAASLQLVEVSLRERTSPDARREFISSITAASDSDLFDFLAEEVLDQQPEETRNFLLTTSILQQITPEVAERLAGVHDGRRELTGLEHRGLFTNRLDDDRYRYHNLFREFLERRLTTERSESEVLGLHIHAASYFETTHQWPEAIHHYLRAGLQRQAARLIAKYGEDVAATGGLGLVDEWLGELPIEVVKQNARLSLLYGEACGFKGKWEVAVEALMRARLYFSRKGDRRMEALACLKLSTIHMHRGEPHLAATVVDDGIALAPADAVATRLRLEGNLAITRTWLTQPLEKAVTECQRIAAEASALGMDHIGAIAHHNAGELLLRIGRVEESVASLELAARFWADPPTSPFADNSELVKALIASGDLARARRIASEAIARTKPWRRSNSDAMSGMAAVLMAEGKPDEAAHLLDHAMGDQSALGGLEVLLGAQRIEALFLAHAHPERMRTAQQRFLEGEPDLRYSSEAATARALAAHSVGECRGECGSAREILASTRRSGADLAAAIASVKVGVLSFDHSRKRDTSHAWDAVAECLDAGVAPALRWWLRLYAPHSRTAKARTGGASLLQRLAEVDPDGWRSAILDALRATEGTERRQLLDALSRHANKATIEALRTIDGPDVAGVRRRLQTLQASRLFLRTFGGVSLHRGHWDGPSLSIDKKRVRTLLAVLAAWAHSSLSRDMCVEILWPNADADSAINSLNQTVFQLRRFIDATYRGGDSPGYVISTAELVGLNPELIHTDLAEIRKLPAQLNGAGWSQRQEAARMAIGLIRGEFLADLPYEAWSSAQQMRVHGEVRNLLLPIAVASPADFAPDVCHRAASALLLLDPWDEKAVVALAHGLARSGQRVAARKVVIDFAARLERELDEQPSGDFVTAARAFAVPESSVR